jgi:WD40 repeat protein/DNA-binding SARP family transcriptional activator
MEFRLLGPVEVMEAGHRRPLGGQRQRAVLVHLLLSVDRPVTTARLIERVWYGDPPPAARSTLQGYLSHLRHALGPARLEHRPQGYVLNAAPEEIDAWRFEQMVNEARVLLPTDAVAAVRRFEAAAALWRGPALADLADQPSLQGEISRLEELRLTATEDRIDGELRLGRHREVLPELRSLVTATPLRERLVGLLLLALYRSGEQGDAITAYQQTSRRLAEEFGLDPGRELRRLYERILAQDPALAVPERHLRGYQLLECIGTGSFSTVHRAYQPETEREVAVKVVQPLLASDPDFIRRFDAEAQVVARVEHPHIVPLYDHWRDPDGAYLVLRLLTGGNLRDRLAVGPPALAEVARVCEQLALALDAAHRRGVVHGDLKPENVLFDADGNAYLTDFGIASSPAGLRARQGGRTLDPYTAPEVLAGDPPTTSSDLYSLAALAAEMLAGHATLPAVAMLLERARSADPHARWSDAPSFATVLHGAILTDTPRTSVSRSIPNPYKGLRPFTEADADTFFGREQLVERLVGRLADDTWRLLAVVGPSGSGKSSVVRAGLLPALRRGAIPGSHQWYVVEMCPGSDPVAALEAGLLRIAAEPLPPDATARLQEPDGLTRAASWVLPDGGSELLVFIDQFEELFDHVDDVGRRDAFLVGLAAAVRAPDSRVRVVVTLRADRYDGPLSNPALAELVGAHTEVVPPLTVEELEDAITGPATAVGLAVEPTLVARMVRDTVDRPGGLPLLQYALTEVCDRREGRLLTAAAYVGLGGVGGALDRRADEVVTALGDGGEALTRQLFLHLVVVTSAGVSARQRVPRAALLSLGPDRDAMANVLDAFAAARLLTLDRDPATRAPTTELGHEALLSAWRRLQRWIEDARTDLDSERRLAARADEWIASGRDPSLLAVGAHLDRFEAWCRTGNLDVVAVERAFLAASVAERDRRQAADAARAAYEHRLERRAVERLRALVALFALLGIVASGLTVVAVTTRTRGQEYARLAVAERLTAAALANLDVDPERSLLLALAAIDMSRSADGVVPRDAEEVLRRAVISTRVIARFDGGDATDVSPDGTLVATVDQASDGRTSSVTLWRLPTGSTTLRLDDHPGRVTGVSFAPDGDRFATTDEDGDVRLCSVDGRTRRLVGRHIAGATRPVFSPDGTQLATGGANGTIRVWDLPSGAFVDVLRGHHSEVSDLAFAPDGSQIASGSTDTTARLSNLGDDHAIELTGHTSSVEAVAFSSDGALLITASTDGTVRVWDTTSGEPVSSFEADGPVHALAVSSDGARLVTGGADAHVAVWDLATSTRLLVLTGHEQPVRHVRFTPAGSGVVSASDDGTTRVWDVSISGGRDWTTVPSARSRSASATFSFDGTRIAVARDGGGISVRETAGGAEMQVLGADSTEVTAVAFAPDGHTLATLTTGGADAGISGSVLLWDLATGRAVGLTKPTDGVTVLAFTRDGHRLLTGEENGTVTQWDATTGDEMGSVTWAPDAVGGSSGPVVGVAEVAGVTMAVSVGQDGALTVWDTASGRSQRTLTGPGGRVVRVAFGPDGVLAAARLGATASVWDLTTGELRWTLHHGPAIHDIAVHPDGTRLVTGGIDGTARVWDLATGEQVLTLDLDDMAVTSLAFSRDGRLLATALASGRTELHLLPVDEFVARARTRPTRSLTDAECATHAGGACEAAEDPAVDPKTPERSARGTAGRSP